jgi:heme o synthase
MYIYNMWKRIDHRQYRSAYLLWNSIHSSGRARYRCGSSTRRSVNLKFQYNNCTKHFRFTTARPGDSDNNTKSLNDPRVLPIIAAPTDSSDVTASADFTATSRIVTTTTKPTSLTKAFLELGKARLSALVVTTTAAGFGAAGPVALSDPSVLVAALAGTAFCSMSAAAVNQMLEVERDRKMKRTQPRPLVTGALSMPQAALAAAMWGTLGPLILWYGTDPLTTSLGMTNMFLYTCIYTPMKPVTTLNTWAGAVVGAIPPVMGYTAASAVITASTPASMTSLAATDVALFSLLTDPVAITLGATLYLWQLPHFMALSYMYRQDYLRGGFVMVPTAYATKSPNNNDATKEDEEEAAAVKTANVIVRYAWYLSMVPIAVTLLNITSSMYALEGCLLNAYALRAAYRFKDQRSNQNARHIFLTSLWYLPCTLMLFLLHSKTWDATVDEKNEIQHANALSQYLSAGIHLIRQKGRELCVHEHATLQGANARQSCPVVVGTEHTAETVSQASQALTDVTESTVALSKSSSSNEENL